MKKSVIIVAGGQGKRMGAGMPKQFLLLQGLPVLMHTINAFSKHPEIEIVLVLPKEHIQEWSNLCNHHQFEVEHQITAGGETRFQSVKNGIELAPAGLIAVHDGVRPFVSPALIESCYNGAENHGVAIPVVKPKESIRRIQGNSSTVVDRDLFVLVQTPQIFKSEILLDAYQQEENTAFTDDASVLELAGYPIHLVQGDYSNIKITTPADLAIAEVVIKDFF